MNFPWKHMFIKKYLCLIMSPRKNQSKFENEWVRSKIWFFTKMNHIWTCPIHFGLDHFILVVTKSLWSSPNQFGQTKTILDQPKVFWSHRRTRQLCISSTIFNQMKIRIPVKDCHRLGIGCRDVGVRKGGGGSRFCPPYYYCTPPQISGRCCISGMVLCNLEC